MDVLQLWVGREGWHSPRICNACLREGGKSCRCDAFPSPLPAGFQPISKGIAHRRLVVFRRSADAELIPNFRCFHAKFPCPLCNPHGCQLPEKEKQGVWGTASLPGVHLPLSWVDLDGTCCQLPVLLGWEDLQGVCVRLVECCEPTSCARVHRVPSPSPSAQQRGAAGWTLHGRSPSWHRFSWRPSTSDSPC